MGKILAPFSSNTAGEIACEAGQLRESGVLPFKSAADVISFLVNNQVGQRNLADTNRIGIAVEWEVFIKRKAKEEIFKYFSG